MVGTIKDGRFAGKWDNAPSATGTFDLAKAPARARWATGTHLLPGTR
jgi:hypothetical protein